MKNLLRPTLAIGYAKETLYGEAWRRTTQYAIGSTSNHFWKDTSSPVVTQVLKYRFGQLWNMKLAYLQQRPYLPGWPMPKSTRCPHCGQPDSGGHILGGCEHRVMKSLYISRHDETMRKILRAINKGKHGAFLKIADIGRDELTLDLGVIDKRIPDWLVSDSTLEACGLAADMRHVLRPDVLLIEVTHDEQIRYTTAGNHPTLGTEFYEPNRGARARLLSRKRKIWLLEGGYTADTKHLAKIAEKEQQHMTLLRALRTQGFDPHLQILTFGVGGTVFEQTKTFMHDNGISPNDTTHLLNQIHLHSVQCLHNIVVQRRQLDTQILRHQTPRPP